MMAGNLQSISRRLTAASSSSRHSLAFTSSLLHLSAPLSSSLSSSSPGHHHHRRCYYYYHPQQRFFTASASVEDNDDVGDVSDGSVEKETNNNNNKNKNEHYNDINKSSSALHNNLKPTQVVKELDRHIVGQHDAKRAVAIAMRNRWRRMQLPDDLRKEVTPRNVLLVGPTGCGKTEVARRMAMLNDAPFLKVEATKFTEVGYHGRDVDQIIRDLMDVSMQLTRRVWTEKLRFQAAEIAEERILDLLTGPAVVSTTVMNNTKGSSSSSSSSSAKATAEAATTATAAATGSHDRERGRHSFREMLRNGDLDDQFIEVDVPLSASSPDRGDMSSMGGGSSSDASSSNPGFAAMTSLFQQMSSAAGGGGSGKNSNKQPMERKKLPISEARSVILQVELDKLLETVDLKKEAIMATEESGIVFIDEIDKICSARDSYSSRSADASAEGVQRDLLPLIEGTTISTKYGNINTEYILFVASGAFHAVKPSDLLPELQGRLPIRVELKGLTEDDLYRILTEPVANLVRQQIAMIGTEGITLVVNDDAIREMARVAALLNRTVENIGARRLHTVMERIMEELSFQAAEMEKGTCLTVDKKLVEERLSEITKSTDLSKYIL